MSPQHLLIIEDEAAIREMLRMALTKAEFVVSEAANVQQARTSLFNRLPELILLDWMLPETSGLDLARQLKNDPQTKHIPIILLTARGEEGDKIRGFDVGVDDYVTKPFSTRELVARIKAVLRRVSPHFDHDFLVIKDLHLDIAEHRVKVGETEVHLGPTEFRLLQFFMQHPEKVYTRTQVLDLVWGSNVYIEERTVDVHIRRLRKALEVHGYDSFVQTVRGVGYRFTTGQLTTG